MNLTIVYFDLNTGYYPSLHHGLAYLFGTLKKINIIPKFYHLTNEAELKACIDLINVAKIDVLALSFTTNQKKYARTFLHQVNHKPKLMIAGGVHGTLAKEKLFDEFSSIDAVAIGESELAFSELLTKLSKATDIYSTKSFYFKINNKIIRNEINPLIQLDLLELPDYSLFNYKKIIQQSGNVFPMMLGRGCPYQCSYCCNHAIRETYIDNSNYVRFPSVEKSIQIIKNNLKLHPQTEKIAFADDTFTLNKKWLREFCETYKKEISLPFICNARVETINEEVLNSLKQAGCISIDFGVETGNEWLRYNILNRKHSNNKIIETFKMVAEKNIKKFSFNIVGLPFETYKMAKETLNLNLRIKPDYGKCFYFYPYPESEISKLCVKYDLLLDNIDDLSGYLEKPTIKELFMSNRQMKRIMSKMQLYFYIRLLTSKFNLPASFYNILLNILLFLKIPFIIIGKFDKGNKATKYCRNILRKYALKFLR